MSDIRAVAGIRTATAMPAAKESGRPQGIALSEHAGAAGITGVAAGTTAQFLLDGQTEGCCACLPVKIPQIVRR